MTFKFDTSGRVDATAANCTPLPRGKPAQAWRRKLGVRDGEIGMELKYEYENKSDLVLYLRQQAQALRKDKEAKTAAQKAHNAGMAFGYEQAAFMISNSNLDVILADVAP